jgi:Protein of unknown function (DUF2567)
MTAVQLEVQPVPEPAREPARAASSRRTVIDSAELLLVLQVLGVVALLGIPLGALWRWLAPPEFVATSPRAPTPGGVLPFVGQSEHRFDDMAIFLLLGLAAGVLTGAALWLFRRLRGPVVLLVGALGSLIAAWLAMRAGLWLAAVGYPNLASTGAPFPRAPVLESSWVVIAQPFGFVVTYCIATAWNRSDELDRGD